MTTAQDPLLQINKLSITFRNRFGETSAVRDLDLNLGENETVAIIGESGSGKSVTALSLTGLLPAKPACEVSGEILYKGENLLEASEKRLRKLRGEAIAYIFQEPSTSLNPVFTVGYQIKEAIRAHLPKETNVHERAIRALDEVGIREPEARLKAYPFEMSGGMQQRVMIAMALACEPRILIADEPTTALDVTIQKQIIDLLKDIKQRRQMAIMMITHNFGIVSGFADRVIVMYRGEVVETGPTEEVLSKPQHPYTQALIACIPRLGAKKRRLTTINAEMIKQ
tara:strand:+ start:14856 stop:15704 length:849 start_codon:yes stop_codon:yes gene_type:complete